MEIVVDTNNEAERQNKDFKHKYLKQSKDYPPNGMWTVLTKHFYQISTEGLDNSKFYQSLDQ